MYLSCRLRVAPRRLRYGLRVICEAFPPIVAPSLKKLESMQVEVYNSILNNGFDDTNRARAILPRRFAGVAPGVSPIAPAAFLAAAIHFENFVCEWQQMKNA